MSEKIDIVVNFNDGTICVFKEINNFIHLANDGVWRIVADDENCSYISDRDVRFIGHKYVWDKMSENSFNEPVEECKCAEKEPPLHKGCWFCKYILTCDKQREYAYSVMESNRCPYYEQDF